MAARDAEALAELLLHSAEKGIARLLAQPRDVSGWVDAGDEARSAADAGEAHRALFREYESALRAAVAESLEWWEGRISALQQREGLERRAALEQAYAAVLGGPSGHPRVVGVVRSFWLACDRLNRAATGARRVRPEVFLLEWLDAERHGRELQVLSGMLYWPLGLDGKNQWV